MNESTAGPAFTRSITRRGLFSVAQSSAMEWVPIIFVSFAGPERKASTFEVVRL